MTYLVLDVETTTFQKGNAFSKQNKLCAFGIRGPFGAYSTTDIEGHLEALQHDINKKLLVGFNIKFDLHWIRKYGIDFSSCSVWDCQLAAFLLSGQSTPYPSLDGVSSLYGLGSKLDVVSTEYWERRCSCHVSVAEKLLQSMQQIFVKDVTPENTKELIEKRETDKNENGERITRNVIKLLKTGELRSLALTLKHRLEQLELQQSEPTVSQMLTMITSWHKQAALFVDQLENSISTTATQQIKLENDCVLHVMLLWDTLRNLDGLTKHNSMCESTPVDTPDIPEKVLLDYLDQDLLLTEQVYHHQLKLFESEPQLYKLFKLQCQDLLVLQEMEYNGMLFNTEEAEKQAVIEEARIKEIEQELMEGYEDIPINFQSRDHLSCYLYGGTIVHEARMPIGVYKTGAKVGLPRYKIVEYKYELPQLIKPPKGSELKKDGYFATDENTLRSISTSKQSRHRLDLILERSKSSKLIGTYYTGIPELIKTMDWPDGTLHGNFNQCVATTGRLSSSRPNLQNFAGEVDKLLISRYETNKKSTI